MRLIWAERLAVSAAMQAETWEAKVSEIVDHVESSESMGDDVPAAAGQPGEGLEHGR